MRDLVNFSYAPIKYFDLKFTQEFVVVIFRQTMFLLLQIDYSNKDKEKLILNLASRFKTISARKA